MVTVVVVYGAIYWCRWTAAVSRTVVRDTPSDRDNEPGMSGCTCPNRMSIVLSVGLSGLRDFLRLM